MQKLVWQNANGDSIDLTSGNYGITQWEGFSNASLNIQSQQVPFQDGAVFLDALLNQRELSVTLKMQDNGNLEERYRMRRELIHALNPKLGEGYLIYTNDFISKRIKCVAQIPLFPTHNSNDSGTPSASLSWTACEPYWEDLNETVVIIDKLGVIENNGDIDVPVKIYNNSAVSELNIMNGEQVIEFRDITGNLIEINTNYGNKKVCAIAFDIKQITTGQSNLSKKIVANSFSKIVEGATNYVLTITGKRIGIDDLYLGFITCQDGFIAYGGDSYQYSLDNGVNWKSDTIPFLSNVAVLAKGYNSSGGTYTENIVAISMSGELCTKEGSTWIDRGTVNILQNGKKLIHLGYYYNFINNANWITSQNGINWTVKKTGTFNDICIVERSNSHIGVCSYGNVIFQHNIENYIESYVADTNLTGIASNYRKIIVVGENGHIYSCNILSEAQYTEWEDVFEISDVFLGVVYSQGEFEAYTQNRSIYSKDGKDWYEKEKYIPENLNAVTPYKNEFITVGNSGAIYSITKDENIVKLASGVSVNLYDCKNYQDKLIAVGGNETILVSANKTNWDVVFTGTTENVINKIVYSKEKNKYVAVGNRILTSTDLHNWTSVYNPSSILNDVIFDGTKFVAVGNNGLICKSEDAESWTTVASGYNQDFKTIAYLNKYVIGRNGKTLESYDLVIFEEMNYYYTTIISDNLYFYALDNYVLRIGDINPVGLGNVAIYIQNNNYGICKNDDYIVVVGGNGFICFVKFTEGENLISKLGKNTNMDFHLKKGKNLINIYSIDNIYELPLFSIVYRQKYIGV